MIKKISIVLKTSYKINLRINSEKNPILYYWLQSIGVKMPPEILAYLILISLLITVLLGLLAETKNINNSSSLNPFYSSLILILSLILVEILIKIKRLEINHLLIRVLPFSKVEFTFLKVVTHFISMRSWCFISFTTLYVIFSNSYGYQLFDHLFFINLLFFFDIFIFVSALTFFFNDKIKSISIKLNVNLIPVFRLFTVLVLLILMKKTSIYTNLINHYGSFEEIIDHYIFLATISTLLIFAITILSCSSKRI